MLQNTQNVSNKHVRVTYGDEEFIGVLCYRFVEVASLPNCSSNVRRSYFALNLRETDFLIIKLVFEKVNGMWKF